MIKKQELILYRGCLQEWIIGPFTKKASRKISKGLGSA